MKWVQLIKATDRLEAEIFKAALEAQGLTVHIFQEGFTHFAYPVNVGPMAEMEVCVPSNQIEEAQAWLEMYLSGEIELNSDEPNIDS